MAEKKKTNYLHLVAAIFICQGAGLLGSLVTFPAISGWYAGLTKPSFSPPNWIFGPIWTLLYLLMGISLYIIWTKKGELKWFWLQLSLNTLWSLIFFGLRNPAWAFIEILVLWYAIFMTISTFSQVYKQAAWLLYPYLAWVTFASILNFSIWVLN